MRLGFVGVGKHARRLAEAFSECGGAVVAHDRERPSEGILDGFGRRMPWREMITAPDVDAIVCCAPPAVTAEVAEAGALGKRMVLTKPLCVDLLVNPAATYVDLSRTVHVDLWRLYSPAWLALKADLDGKELRSVSVSFCGDGPVRATHSGLLDYGPHALAFLLDLGLKPELMWQPSQQPGQWIATGRAGFAEVHVRTGNAWAQPDMCVQVSTADGSRAMWLEAGNWQEYHVSAERPMVGNHRDLALRSFCRAFLAGEPSATLRISCEAMRILSAVDRSGPSCCIAPG